MTKKEKVQKVFVLDTNVILHDWECIYKFQEHDVVIPITVVEELDKFKKGSEEKNFHTRMFIRKFDQLTKNSHVFNGGASLGPGKGVIQVKLCSKINSKVKEALAEDTKDHRILSVVCDLLEQELNNKKRKVILVTKDANLRIKARSLAIEAEDYENDKVANLDMLYTGTVNVSTTDTLIKKIFDAKDGIAFDELKTKEEIYPNMFLILKGNKSNAIVRVDTQKNRIIKLEKIRISGIMPRNAEQTFSLNALLDSSLKLVTLSGKAGTGKTLLALAAGIEQLIKGDYDKVLLARPIVELSNKTLGFLPGTADEKVDPYMQPLFDNLAVIKNTFGKTQKELRSLDDLQKSGKLEIIPLAFVRGRSLNKCYWIIDESQNLTPHEVKTIVTRAGEGSKLVFTGDPEQIDSPYLDSTSNGLSYLIEKWKGYSMYGHITLIKGERSELAELASRIM